MRSSLSLPVAALLLCAVGGCNSSPVGSDAAFYTYLDAQGNLVTIERAPRDQNAPPEDGTPSATAAIVDGETYLPSEEMDHRLEQRERDRFVTWRDPQGNVITEKVDLIAEREAAAQKEPDFQAVKPERNFLEAWSRIAADCCAFEAAPRLLQEEETLQISFIPRSTHWLELPAEVPAEIVELAPQVAVVGIQSFIRNGRALMPQLLFLDESAAPLLLVANPFSRQYPDSWARYARLEGAVEVPPSARFVAVLLRYASRGSNGMPVLDSSHEVRERDGEGEAAHTLDGELVIRGGAFE